MGKNNRNIRYIMCRELEKQIKIGTKKTADRDSQYRETGEHKAQYIHSNKTVDTYMQHTKEYGDWLREHGLAHCSLSEAREHAGEYIMSFHPHTHRRPSEAPWRGYLDVPAESCVRLPTAAQRISSVEES